jgi:ATP-dependent Clp endopeptidase proteolytic subunit ClpP
MINEESLVFTEGNTVFFFCDVDEDSVRDLCVALQKLSLKYETIRIAIQSSGGDLYPGLAAMDFIRNLKRNVETIVYGYCASAATFLLLGGTKRIMGKNAWMLIHQMSSECGGTYQDLKADMKTNKKLMKQFREIYTEYSNLTPEQLDEFMQRDITLSAKKCLKYGIIHEVI